jgi:hypothetical protein
VRCLHVIAAHVRRQRHPEAAEQESALSLVQRPVVVPASCSLAPCAAIAMPV